MVVTRPPLRIRSAPIAAWIVNPDRNVACQPTAIEVPVSSYGSL